MFLSQLVCNILHTLSLYFHTLRFCIATILISCISYCSFSFSIALLAHFYACLSYKLAIFISLLVHALYIAFFQHISHFFHHIYLSAITHLHFHICHCFPAHFLFFQHISFYHTLAFSHLSFLFSSTFLVLVNTFLFVIFFFSTFLVLQHISFCHIYHSATACLHFSHLPHFFCHIYLSATTHLHFFTFVISLCFGFS